MERILLKGHIVDAPVLGNLKVTENGYLFLEDGVIQGRYRELPEELSDIPVVDCGSSIIMPSFADMHLHAPQYAMLGMGMDLPLLDWLNTYTFPTEKRYENEEYARKIYSTLAKELVDNGTTRIAMFSSIHVPATLVCMEEMEKAGLTGFVGKVNMDRNGGPLEENTQESLKNTEKWIEACNFDHIKPMITPRFTVSCTDELMAGLGKIAREGNLPVQSHLSENIQECEFVRELCPDCSSYWETYNKAGLLKNNTLMAHCVYSDRFERQALIEHNAVVVHCPDSNTNLASGTAPIAKMLDEGVRVTLGSDIAGGAILPMLGVMAAALRASKVKRIETSYQDRCLTVPESFYLGTSAGAVYCGSQPGFAHGDKLHAVVIDDSRFPNSDELKLPERLERIMYRAQADDIKIVFSDGRVVKDIRKK